MKLANERVTPAKVEAELAPLRKGEEVRQTLESLRALGAEVAYYQADLADDAATRAMVQRVARELGPIDVLVHGAGVEESRLIAEKSEGAFHRVFDGKAIGGRALLESVLPHAFVVSMGSVAGRFGNPGQVDYAAANDAMARMCLSRPHSLHIDWTAWDDVGMAVRGGMRSLLEGRGVDLLPADAGAALLADLIGARVSGEIVVAGALGDFEPGPAHPLLDSLEVSGNTARGTRVLTLARDGWIEDHAIEGTPVLPGVVGIELMGAVAKSLFPADVFAGVTDVSFDAPAKVYRNEPTTLHIEAHRIAPGRARARLVSTRTLRTGRVQETEHFSAHLVFGDVAPVDGLPGVFLPDEPVDRAGIYRRFFHGPQFQVLSGIVGVSADGLTADGVSLVLRDNLLTDALVVEAAFQAAGMHRMIVHHQMGLPHTGSCLADPAAGQGRGGAHHRRAPGRRRLRHRYRLGERASAADAGLRDDRPWAGSATGPVPHTPHGPAPLFSDAARRLGRGIRRARDRGGECGRGPGTVAHGAGTR